VKSGSSTTASSGGSPNDFAGILRSWSARSCERWESSALEKSLWRSVFNDGIDSNGCFGSRARASPSAWHARARARRYLRSSPASSCTVVLAPVGKPKTLASVGIRRGHAPCPPSACPREHHPRKPGVRFAGLPPFFTRTDTRARVARTSRTSCGGSRRSARRITRSLLEVAVPHPPHEPSSTACAPGDLTTESTLTFRNER